MKSKNSQRASTSLRLLCRPLFVCVLCVFGTAAFAAETPLLTFSESWVRAMPPSAGVAAGYGQFRNGSDEPIHIVSLVSPLAERVEIHEMKHVDGKMQMRELKEPTIAPGETLTLVPGGFHFMFMGLVSRPVAGDEVHLTVELDNGNRVDFTLPVRKPDQVQR